MPGKALALSRLLQLASPMLPVGAYSYSQGLEWTIECGDVTDKATAEAWIGAVLTMYQGQFELPLLHRLMQAWAASNQPAVSEWDAFYQAGRDTAEAHAESRQMGYSLVRLLSEFESLPGDWLTRLQAMPTPAFITVYAGIADQWQISPQQALHAYAWSWLENQVSAAMKAVPLGQVAGQKILLELGGRLPALVASAMALPDEDISNFCPGLSIAGCRHETQYTRLFRS
ncbi:urease accessory protein UreF [Methylovorus menthalis]|uniref:urease accessory protein UreF n=1 Tax=Methylovorus menthalis TaxID=1002227 RepID=UPI001E35A590|nr:urease accessory protein UreF [Methylovorus menthalis]MCB4812402.1 urease accessory protein UreF [Methylovorus menthalis]